MNNKRSIPVTLITCLTLYLAACGGGGNGNNNTTVELAPDATILFPPSQSLSEADTVTVRGTAIDDDEISVVRVNGVDAISSDGFATWEATVPLNPGINILTVETGDINNNQDPSAASVIIDSGPLMEPPAGLALDPANNRMLTVDELRGQLIAIDLDSAARSVISPHDAGFSFQLDVRGMALDAANGRALVLRIGEFGTPDTEDIVAVDLASGDRSIFSDNASPAGGPDFLDPVYIALDATRGRALVADDQFGVIAVDLGNGTRSSFYPIDQPNGIAIDGDRLLIANPSDQEITAVELDNPSNDQTFSSDGIPNSVNNFNNPDAIAVDAPNNRALVVDDDGSDNNLLMAVNLTDGARTIFSSTTVGGADNPFDSAAYVAIDTDRDRALVVDTGGIDGVLAVDLTSGARTVFSAASLPDAELPLFSPEDLVVDTLNDRLLLADIDRGGVLIVDMTNGVRSQLNSTLSPNDIAFDAVGNRLLAINGSALYEIDQDTGIDTELTDVFTFSPEALAVDGNNRAWVGNGPEIAEVDLGDNSVTNPFMMTGDVMALAMDTVNNDLLVLARDGPGNTPALSRIDLDGPGGIDRFSDNQAPNTDNPFNAPVALLVDNANNRILVADGTRILSVDSTSGARSILSGPGLPNGNNEFVEAWGMQYNTQTGHLLVVDKGIDSIVALDPASGERIIWSR